MLHVDVVTYVERYYNRYNDDERGTDDEKPDSTEEDTQDDE